MILVLLLFIHLLFLVNTKFTLWPEMVVYPYLLNNGFLLYRDIINPYPPLFIGFLATFTKLFGYDPRVFQFLTWTIILVIDFLIFRIAKKITKKEFYAISSLVFFIILSIPFSVNGLWFDLIQTPFILFSFYFIFRYLKEPKNSDLLFFSIFHLTIAFLIKQQTVILFLWFFVLLFLKFKIKALQIIKKNLIFFLPLVVVLILEIFTFWQKNLLSDFVFWTLNFPFILSSKLPGYILLPTIRQLAVSISVIFLFLPLIFKKKSHARQVVFFSVPLFFFSYPRFDYFHLVPQLAVLSLAFGENLKTIFKSNLVLRTFSMIAFLILITFSSKYFMNNLTHQVRFFEKEIISQAIFLEKITHENEPIYIQNGPDQILPIANRLPTKPWADEFPWYLEITGVQDKIVSSLEYQKPRFIIFKPYDRGKPYELGVYRPGKIASYIEKNYQNLLQISPTLWLKMKK